MSNSTVKKKKAKKKKKIEGSASTHTDETPVHTDGTETHLNVPRRSSSRAHERQDALSVVVFTDNHNLSETERLTTLFSEHKVDCKVQNCATSASARTLLSEITGKSSASDVEYPFLFLLSPLPSAAELLSDSGSLKLQRILSSHDAVRQGSGPLDFVDERSKPATVEESTTRTVSQLSTSSAHHDESLQSRVLAKLGASSGRTRNPQKSPTVARTLSDSAAAGPAALHHTASYEDTIRRPSLLTGEGIMQLATDAADLTHYFKTAYEETVSNRSRANILVTGCSGTGKSSVINSIFGQEIAVAGAGVPITQHFQMYQPENKPVTIYDSAGLEYGKHEKYTEEVTSFLQQHALSKKSSAKDIIHVVWYVVDTSSARFQPFEAKICRTVFRDFPILFLLNKSDLTSKSDRADLIAAIESFKLTNCVGILQTVTVDKDIVKKGGGHIPQYCLECGSEDVSFKKKKMLVVCDECGHAHSVKVSAGLDLVVEKTIELLPSFLRESFIAAQGVNIRFKEEQSGIVCREFREDLMNLKRYPGERTIQHMQASVITRLSLLWEFTSYAELHGAHIADVAGKRQMHQKKKKRLVEKMFHFLGMSKEETLMSTAVAVLWAVCLATLERHLAEHALLNVEQEDEVAYAQDEVHNILDCYFTEENLSYYFNRLQSDNIDVFKTCWHDIARDNLVKANLSEDDG